MIKKCKFYVTEEYNNKLESIFDDLNIFEVSDFKESHNIIVIKNVKDINDEINPEDIFAIDDITYDVFIKHLSCYFSNVHEYF
jgi:hypothetical protein